MTLQIIDTIGNHDIATVYLAKTREGNYLEFVESRQPPLTRKDKWVLIVSVLFGCPIGCLMCDAGSNYCGKVSREEILAQIDCLVDLYYPNKVIDCRKFKIQFARMGEPTLNPDILDVLEELPTRYSCDNLIPSFSTIAPTGCDDFLTRLIGIKNSLYSGGKFQMQFSIHTTDQKLRDKIIPSDKWDFNKIASYGEKFYSPGDNKITLNFALAKTASLDIKELKKYFSPELFIIKITPVNPTLSALANNLDSYFTNGDHAEDVNRLIEQLEEASYDVVLSIGDLEENHIGSNCGQYIRKFMLNGVKSLSQKMYTYAQKSEA